MEFRPCIDIHNGKVKQIVGGTLQDEGNRVSENFVSGQDAPFYARLYQEHGIRGGHIVLLNKEGTQYYETSRAQALAALAAYPGGMQVGGGITAENAEAFLEAGASHVIVTSYVFRDGAVAYGNLQKMVKAVGREHLTLDFSCRKRENGYYIVTDRWQKNTQVRLTEECLDTFCAFCDEFLIHAVDVEGKSEGIETELAALLGGWSAGATGKEKRCVTYAGGVHSFEDLAQLKGLGQNRIHVTIGSALDLFGGPMKFGEVLNFIK